jgi:ubiquinone/menaquinone biosynthesis C-methylase UbiE
VDKSLTRVRDTWNHLGEIDPMWAILTDPRKFGGRWSEDEFFSSGQTEIDAVMRKVDRFVPRGRKERALDFGCGMGRLTRALRAHYDRVDGVDVAPSMIALANERNAFPEQCAFHLNVASDLALFADESFDLIYSNIVLQHIAPALAVHYLTEFARCTRAGGLIVIRLPHRRLLNVPSLKRYFMHAVYNVLPASVIRLHRRRKHRQLPRTVVDALPKIPMEMHRVSRSRVESALRGCALVDLENTGSRSDAFIFYTYIFEKQPPGSSPVAL